MSASMSASPQRRTDALTGCQLHPSSEATSLTGRLQPAWRVAQRPARVVSRSRGGRDHRVLLSDGTPTASTPPRSARSRRSAQPSHPVDGTPTPGCAEESAQPVRCAVEAMIGRRLQPSYSLLERQGILYPSTLVVLFEALAEDDDIVAVLLDNFLEPLRSLLCLALAKSSKIYVSMPLRACAGRRSLGAPAVSPVDEFGGEKQRYGEGELGESVSWLAVGVAA